MKKKVLRHSLDDQKSHIFAISNDVGFGIEVWDVANKVRTVQQKFFMSPNSKKFEILSKKKHTLSKTSPFQGGKGPLSRVVNVELVCHTTEKSEILTDFQKNEKIIFLRKKWHTGVF